MLSLLTRLVTFFGEKFVWPQYFWANSDLSTVAQGTEKFTDTVMNLDEINTWSSGSKNESTTTVILSGSRHRFTAQLFSHCYRRYQSMHHAQYSAGIITQVFLDCMRDNFCVYALRQHFQKFTTT